MRRSSVLLKWVITYMLIIMIPLGCFAYGIIHSTAVVREQVALSNRQTLSSLSERTDRLLSRMSSMLFYVASQTSLADFAQVWKRTSVCCCIMSGTSTCSPRSAAPRCPWRVL